MPTTFETRTPPAPLGQTRTPPAPLGQTRTPPAPLGQTRTPPAPLGHTRTPPTPLGQTRTPPVPLSTIGPRPHHLPIAPVAPSSASRRRLPLADAARPRDEQWRPRYAVWEITLA